MLGSVVAVPQLRTSQPDPTGSLPRQDNPLGVIQGSLSASKVARQSPVLAGLHRVADGSMVGVLLAVAVLSGLTLHWQHRWTMAFSRLEATRTLVHRFTESTAMFERYLLKGTTLPEAMVPTKAANLLYLNRPATRTSVTAPATSALLNQLMDHPINPGY